MSPPYFLLMYNIYKPYNARARFHSGCVYKILCTENHGFETRIWNTVLKNGFTEERSSFLPSVFLALSDCVIAAHLILRSLSLGKRSNRAHTFRSQSLWRHLNRVWDRSCVYKIFKTVFLEKHGFESHLFVCFKTVFKFMTTVYKIL